MQKQKHHHHRELRPASTKPTLAQPLSTLIEESKTHSAESLHYSSPPRPETPARFDDPDEKSSSPCSENGAGAMILAEKYYSPLTSPGSVSPPKDAHATLRDDFPPSRLLLLNSFRSFNLREQSPPPLSPTAPPPQPPVSRTGIVGPPDVLPAPRSSSSLPDWREESPQPPPPPPPLPPPPARSGIIVGGGGGERKEKVGLVKASKMKMGLLKKVGFGMRVLEIVFCVVSFSVMATDKTQGWSGDSFDRYKEYRFCLTVNIMGFAYAGIQALNLALHLATGIRIISHHFCHIFDFIVDQIIAYLLVSASTAAATRATDWQANWGKDEFTEKASMSVSMAFLAFIAFAFSSLISGYSIFYSHH